MTEKQMKRPPPRAETTPKAKTKTRRTPKQTRAIASRENVIVGAKAALTEFGYTKLTMRNVASRSNTGVGTIYDYFSSKHAMLRELLQERLALRLEVFDETYADTSTSASVATFIQSYLQKMKTQGLWSKYDMELHRAAEADDDMQRLLDWHHEQTQKRYVDALLVAGSVWPKEDLQVVADYLITISNQFEQSLALTSDERSQKVTSWLIRKTFLSVVRDTLLKKPQNWL